MSSILNWGGGDGFPPKCDGKPPGIAAVMSTAGDTIGALLLERAREAPDDPYILLGDRRMTYGGVAEASERVAGGLQRLGVAKGDRVALMLPNCEEYVFAYFACNRLGAIMVPLNTYLRGKFLSYQLTDSHATLLITDFLGLEQSRLALQSATDIKNIVLVGDGSDPTSVSNVPITSFNDFLGAAALDTLPEITTTDISGIIYTSGTTGMPKGCVVTHGYCVSIARALCRHGYFAPRDRAITSWPIFHTGGYVYALLIPLVAKGSVVLEAQFSASGIIARARETGATVFWGMGAMAKAMLAQPPSPRDSDNALRFAFILPCKADVREEFQRRFGLEDVCAELYGQTECVPVTLKPLDRPRKRDSAGFPRPEFEIRIADPEDNALPTGSVGEILVRPKIANVMFAGYWNNPKASFEASRNLWHHTGDFGRVDDDGYLYFVDRKKDAIRRRGEFVSSMELEQALLGHPDIAVVAAHAVPSDMTEDDIKVWIVPVEGRSLNPEGLFEYCSEILPYFAVPRFVEVVPELPVNAMARVQKHELKAIPNTEKTWDLEKLGIVVSRDRRRG